ncbi:unnamed protein product [Rotaria magnacalcarata]|uniref:EGF-like domain-containing protein n=1 Tax=Rotaria magnacalcarata TaxID=392030 RepID=A0A818ZDS3_9BILA|nr:unnamed protein product [Rotaria magnacalcarata]CAF3763534.1 unnamed protein product [Rotaria magnacalcarata]
MDDAACVANMTQCLTDSGLKYCDAGKDICLQRGLCITSIIYSNRSACICYPCYYGDTCENEIFSRNLWTVGLPYSPAMTPKIFYVINSIMSFFIVITIINSVLCLQTYFCSKRVRITNVGVYLIFNAIISFLLGLMLSIQSITSWLPQYIPEDYWKISCLIDRKFVYMSLAYMLGWSIFLIGFERMLVECFHYSLYDSRKRSFITLTSVCIICSLTTIPGIFTLKNLSADQLGIAGRLNIAMVTCVNYTSLGYIIDKIILSIHVYGTFILYIVLCVVVFKHILRHRRKTVPAHTTPQNVRIILHKHRDFFIPLLASIICSTPMIVVNEIMTCAKVSESKSVPYIYLFGSMFTSLPIALSFFTFIYPANVYMTAFWKESFVGRCLRKMKTKIVCKRKKLTTLFTSTNLNLTPISTRSHELLT